MEFINDDIDVIQLCDEKSLFASQLQEYDDNNNKKYILLKKIEVLYNSVFKDFRNGDKIVYNPYIMSKLSLEKFVDWIVENNKYVADIMNK